MKKYIPHILIILLVAAVITLFLTGGNNRKNKLDERITLRKKDKIPYGVFIAYQGLEYLFPGSRISVNKQRPGSWEEIDPDVSGQALIVITNKFAASTEEMEDLVSFVRKGNDVFISAMYLSAAADNMFNLNSSAIDLSYISIKDLDENMKFSITDPPFNEPLKYGYPGRTFSSFFTSLDTATTRVLGRDLVGRANFIQLRTGRGHFFVHLEPLAFSNYFLLHKENLSFYKNAMALIRPGAKHVAWDEYYRFKQEPQGGSRKKQGWLSVLFRYPAFKAALITALLALLVYVLMEMRRKQRAIPVIKKPRNESLDFVKTIGRLYYEKGDHRNLCRKMAAYFLEHVRNKYKLPTNTLDDEFMKSLHYKSGVPEANLKEILNFIRSLDNAATITADQLSRFHKKLETFYKET